MLPELDRAAEEVISAIQREVPEYARPHDDSYTSTVRRAVRHALHQFAQQIADPATPREGTAQLFGDIGRIEAAEGRSLEPLQTALRLGARVSWRRLYQAAGQSSLDTDVLARIGEAIFLYLDELAAACAEGFARASATRWHGAAAGWTRPSRARGSGFRSCWSLPASMEASSRSALRQSEDCGLSLCFRAHDPNRVLPQFAPLS